MGNFNFLNISKVSTDYLPTGVKCDSALYANHSGEYLAVRCSDGTYTIASYAALAAKGGWVCESTARNLKEVKTKIAQLHAVYEARKSAVWAK